MSDECKMPNGGRRSGDAAQYERAEDIIIVAALLVHSGRTCTAKGIVAELQHRFPEYANSSSASPKLCASCARGAWWSRGMTVSLPGASPVETEVALAAAMRLGPDKSLTEESAP